MNDQKQNLLFLCTGNSCRSQMAEGFAKTLLHEQYNAFSAGIECHGKNPYAVKVMAELDIDISNQESQNVSDLDHIHFDHVLAVCAHAHENCPTFPGATNVLCVRFDDPPKLAANAKTEEEKLNAYRKVRDEIKQFIATLPTRLAPVT